MFSSLLDVERIDDLVFRSTVHRQNFRRTVFGGQVLAQALMACLKTVNDRPAHSFHAYFLRAGSTEQPIEYHVENIRDGRSISSRRVVAKQSGKVIFHLSASFHAKETGYSHSDAIPSCIPSPDSLYGDEFGPTPAPEHGDTENEASPFTILPIPKDLFTSSEQHPPESKFWVKTVLELPDSPAFHLAALAFASDLGLLATALLPHPTNLFSKDIVAASIDHAMWLHTDKFKMTDWLLFSIRSPWADNARGLSHATIFDKKGNMVASTSQEGLIRPQ